MISSFKRSSRDSIAISWLAALAIAGCAKYAGSDCAASLTCELSSAGASGKSVGSTGGTAGGGTGAGGTSAGGTTSSGGSSSSTTQAAAKVTATVVPVVRIAQSASQTVKIAVTRDGGAAQRILVAAVNLPSGISSSPTTISASSTEAALPIQLNSSVPVGGPTQLTISVTSPDDASVSLTLSCDLYVVDKAGAMDASLSKSSQIATTISPGGKDIPSDVAADSKGRIVVVGSGKTSANSDQAWAARFSPRGDLDTGFGSGGKLAGFGNSPSYAQKVVVKADGVYVWATSSLGGTTLSFIRKLTETGTASPSFGANQTGDAILSGVGSAIALVPQGDGLLGLAAPTGKFVALKADGTIDSAFAPPSTGSPSALAVDSQRRVLYGEVRTGSYAISRLTPTGSADLSFGTNGTATVNLPTGATSSRFVALAVASTGLVAGLVQSTTGATANENLVSLIGFGTNGSSTGGLGDPSTGVKITSALGTGYGAIVQDDGKVVVLHGDWNSTSQRSTYRLGRYDNAGKLDTSFASSGIFDVSAAAPTLTPIGLGYDPFGGRVIVFGNTADGILIFRVWL